MNNVFPSLQSSYRKFHSTESALLKVKNDILLNMNRQHVILFVLLDLSAAFDTIDHGILLERLRSAFGVRDMAPKLWNAVPRFIRESISVDTFKRKLKTHLFKKAFCTT